MLIMKFICIRNPFRICFSTMFICLLLIIGLLLPIAANAQFPSAGFYGYPTAGSVGYGYPGLQATGYGGFGYGGYNYGSLPMIAIGGYGYTGFQPTGYGGFGYSGFPMTAYGGYSYGNSYAIQPLTEEKLLSKIEDLDSDETAQISKSGKLDGYFECQIIYTYNIPTGSNIASTLDDLPYLVDSEMLVGILKDLLNDYNFVFVTKDLNLADQFLIQTNDSSYINSSSSNNK